MLSILIPTYNYNVYPLVLELHKQCLECQIEFEIIVFDDASKSELNIENEKINSLTNCFFKILELNIGRSSIRNLLAKQSKFENLLFLDADTIPISKDFIKNYVSNIDVDEKVIYGGIKYQNDKIKDGIEFDKDGNVIFEYFYNEAEEISKKIEYEYHNNGKRIKEEVNY